jgi:hypothetical protein
VAALLEHELAWAALECGAAFAATAITGTSNPAATAAPPIR